LLVVLFGPDTVNRTEQLSCGGCCDRSEGLSVAVFDQFVFTLLACLCRFE